MKFGFLAVNSAAGISPGRLASEVEARGYESVWLPEHSHIPTSRRTPYPAGGELPAGYLHMMNPFVSLAAAIGTTTNLTLATGICLALEHDLLDLATTATTLDVLSGGRFVMGIGAGWNAEELANHQPGLPFGRRYRALEERIGGVAGPVVRRPGVVRRRVRPRRRVVGVPQARQWRDPDRARHGRRPRSPDGGEAGGRVVPDRRRDARTRRADERERGDRAVPQRRRRRRARSSERADHDLRDEAAACRHRREVRRARASTGWCSVRTR